MFDKMIESNTSGAEFRNRSRYFMISSVVVGILFLAAVVYSIYAAEIGLGSSNLEIGALMAPVETVEPEHEQELDRTHSNAVSQENSDRTVRRVLMASPNMPTIMPTGVSTTRNSYRSSDRFEGIKIGDRDVDAGSPGPGREGTGTSSNTAQNENDEDVTRAEAPPAAVKKPPSILRTSRVLNGEAISLPKPAYPQPAVVLNLQGSVKVQVTIDEKGNVISAKAADGHPFFRLVAEQAARNARFKPTLLNDEPVKVTGVIVYNFRRN